jgi:hypothetical protein
VTSASAFESAENADPISTATSSSVAIPRTPLCGRAPAATPRATMTSAWTTIESAFETTPPRLTAARRAGAPAAGRGCPTSRTGRAAVRGDPRSQNATDVFDDAVCCKLGINRTDPRYIDILERHGPLTAGELVK